MDITSKQPNVVGIKFDEEYVIESFLRAKPIMDTMAINMLYDKRSLKGFRQ